MPMGLLHHCKHLPNVVLRYLAMEQVTYRIHEDHLRLLFAKRLREPLWQELDLGERPSVLCRHGTASWTPSTVMALVDAMTPVVQCEGIAIVAPRCDTGASCQRIPGHIGPFDG